MGLFGQSCNKIPQLSNPPNIVNEILNVVGTDINGNPVLLTSLGAQDRVLWLDVGAARVYWKDISSQLIPAFNGSNNGFFFRASGFVSNIAPQGVPYQLAANPGVDNTPGIAPFVSPADIGKVLTIGALGLPEFQTLPSNSVNISGAVTNIDKVRGKSLTVSTLNVTADELVVSDGSTGIVLTNVSENIDITVAGAGGLDAGAEATSTWYYIYIISDGVLTAGLLSNSLSTPILPVGYTHFGRVGVVRNNGAGDFIGYIQNGEYIAVDQQAMCSGQLIPALPAVTIPQTTASLANLIPPISKTVDLNIIATCAAPLNFVMAGSDGGLRGMKIGCTLTSAGIGGDTFSGIPLENPLAPQVYWARTGAAATNGDCLVAAYTIK